MEKILKIEDCINCCWLSDGTDVAHCVKSNFRELGEELIPSWCPLPTADPDPLELIAWHKECSDFITVVSTEGYYEALYTYHKSLDDLFALLEEG